MTEEIEKALDALDIVEETMMYIGEIGDSVLSEWNPHHVAIKRIREKLYAALLIQEKKKAEKWGLEFKEWA